MSERTKFCGAIPFKIGKNVGSPGLAILNFYFVLFKDFGVNDQIKCTVYYSLVNYNIRYLDIFSPRKNKWFYDFSYKFDEYVLKNV